MYMSQSASSSPTPRSTSRVIMTGLIGPDLRREDCWSGPSHDDWRNVVSAICSSARRPCALRPRDTCQVSKMSSQGVLRLLPLLTAHSTWQHVQSLEDKERSPSREASS